jgi:hypothetical protein
MKRYLAARDNTKEEFNVKRDREERERNEI